MKAAGYDVRESDPFLSQSPMSFTRQMRGPVLDLFPAPPGIPSDTASYLKQVEDVYTSDAYHSLSIEGYQVSHELIEKVLKGQNAGQTAEEDHSAWYRALFGPSVTTGSLKPSDLAGYRNGPVYIRKSMHVPPNREAVRDLMPAFFDLLAEEQAAQVRVVLGHFVFVYIHPYLDGNGRIGRFLMNIMMASGGYPWTIIPVEKRNEYMAALEAASVGQDIRAFTNLMRQQHRQRHLT